MTITNLVPARDAAPRDDIREIRPLAMRIAGVPVIIEGLEESVRARAHALLRPFVVHASSIPASADHISVSAVPDAPRWAVAHRGYEVMSTINVDQLLSYLDWLTVAQGLQASAEVAVYHAAALRRDKSVALLVAESGSGKTTLTLGLMQRGWEPLADDIVLVDCQTLGITPFLRCFHVDAATKAMVHDPSLLVWPGVEGFARPARWASGSQHATCVVLVQREPGGQSQCQPILQAEAAGALAAAAIRNQVPPVERVRVAAHLVAGTRACVRLHNGQLEGALDLIEAATS